MKVKIEPPRAYLVELGRTTYWVVGETEAGKLRARKVNKDGTYGAIQTIGKPPNDPTST